jgi:hypothetical protein
MLGGTGPRRCSGRPSTRWRRGFRILQKTDLREMSHDGRGRRVRRSGGGSRQSGATLSEASAMTAAFQSELQSLQGTMLYTGREVSSMSRSIGGGLRRAFDGVVFDGMRLSDALRTVATRWWTRPTTPRCGRFRTRSAVPIANGMNGLSVRSFAVPARGRDQPGAGDALRPWRRRARPYHLSDARRLRPDGRGGARGDPAAGARGGRPLGRREQRRRGSVHVTMNITTPDVQGFRRSQSQVAAEMGRALARGQRNR